MVKPDYSRDYYADLELTASADVLEIKKQFKKLALKYHPDRNPGQEDAAKDKFLVIQAAHEILTDPALKIKYDTNRKRSYHPTASGVRGNPYSNVARDVSEQWGAPPKRRPDTTARPSASSRYSGWTAPPPKAKPESAYDHLKAWDRMRSAGQKAAHAASSAAAAATGKSPRPESKPKPPPPPPRTAYQARQQEASFGTRKPTGFAPTSPLGDEPPVKNHHYTHIHTNLFEQTASNLKKEKSRATESPVDLSEQFGETFLDNRQRTPYASHVRERTNPFEGASAARAKSVRDTSRRAQEAEDNAAPQRPQRQRSASVGESESGKKTKENTPFNGFGAVPDIRFPSQASVRYSPRPPEPATGPPPTGYPFPTPSGSTASSANATVNGGSSQTSGPNVFTVPDDDDDVPPSAASQQARFMRNSTDNINTRFVAGENAGEKYMFNAGGATGAEDPFLRAKQRSRSTPRGRQTPSRTAFATSESQDSDNDPNAESRPSRSGFDPEEWSEKIGPHNFVPPQVTRTSASPTRQARGSRKTKPVRMTAGNAGLVDEEHTSEEERIRPTLSPESVDGVPSPVPMDIDTPEEPPTPSQPSGGARTMNVEPSKPEWRAGDGNAQPGAKTANGASVPKHRPNAAGSEDTDNIRPVFAEFRNVEPFAPKPTGLGSLGDLKNDLPFDSKPSAKLPLAAEEKPKEPVVVVPFPKAPTPPPALSISGLTPSRQSWNEYVTKFTEYLQLWAKSEKHVHDHFAARDRVGEGKGDKRFAWTNVRSSHGCEQYLRERDEDREIMRQWMAACEVHEREVRMFMRFRERMKGGMDVV